MGIWEYFYVYENFPNNFISYPTKTENINAILYPQVVS